MSNERRLGGLLTQLLQRPGPTRWVTILVILAFLGVVFVRPDLFTDPSPDSEVRQQRQSRANDDVGSPPRQTDAVTSESAQDAGRLTLLAGDVYQSPAGLLYTPGSQHGHRLKHLMAHSRDAPNRPGQHGVFADGDQGAIIALVDEVYRMGERGDRAALRKNDRDRTVLTADMGRKIGYIGGERGNRRGRPPAQHVRVVLEDTRVITAYPVVP